MKPLGFFIAFLVCISVLICFTACRSTAITPNPDGSMPTITHVQSDQNTLSQISNTSKGGVVGLDARWSEFGEYMQKMISSTQERWYSLLRDSDVSAVAGSWVMVTLKLKADGQVFILKVEETAGTPAAYMCLKAIRKGQPYSKWTDQMISGLGSEQTITFRFFYE